MSIEIIATDKHSKKTTRRVFSLRNIGLFKPMVDEWLKKEVPFQECDLSTIDRIEEFTNEVRQILDELSVTEHKCELQQLCSKLIEELRIRIEDRACSSLPEWEEQARRLGVVLN